jgi:hypothetical protein
MTDNREQTPPPTAEQVIADIDTDTAARLKRAEIAKKQADAEQPQEPSDTTPIPTAKEVIADIDADTATRLEKAKTAK